MLRIAYGTNMVAEGSDFGKIALAGISQALLLEASVETELRVRMMRCVPWGALLE